MSPGYIATRLTRAVVVDDRLLARVVGRIPLGRIGRVEDVADVVAFLSSVDAAYVTGQEVVVDGRNAAPAQPPVRRAAQGRAGESGLNRTGPAW